VLAICGMRLPKEAFVNTESGLAPCRLRRGRVPSKAITCSSMQRGNVHCAWDSHFHQTVVGRLSRGAPPLLRRLDKTRHRLSPAGDADRPCQKQDRTRGRKRVTSKAVYHPPLKGDTACLYHKEQDDPSSSSERGLDLETIPVHFQGR
jgi:hypothetical protein